MGEFNLGDVVVDTHGQIGKISNPNRTAGASDFRVTYRFPVLFPWKSNVLWYSSCECRQPTEAERKHHFKECISARRIKT